MFLNINIVSNFTNQKECRPCDPIYPKTRSGNRNTRIEYTIYSEKDSKHSICSTYFFLLRGAKRESVAKERITSSPYELVSSIQGLRPETFRMAFAPKKVEVEDEGLQFFKTFRYRLSEEKRIAELEPSYPPRLKSLDS